MHSYRRRLDEIRLVQHCAAICATAELLLLSTRCTQNFSDILDIILTIK